MQNTLTTLIGNLMIKYGNKIKDGSCELTADQQNDILSAICHTPLKKDEACRFLNLSRSRFDDLVREGKMPRGRKRKHYKELFWYEDELRKLSCR